MPGKAHAQVAQRRFIHYVIETRRNKVNREKGKLQDLLTDKMLFALKQRDDNYPRIRKRMLYRSLSTALSKAEYLTLV